MKLGRQKLATHPISGSLGVSAGTASRATRRILPWRRFWVPLGGAIHCGDNGAGFLTDPGEFYGKHINPNISSLIDLLPETGAIVLCGEPGMGKSTELTSVRAGLEAEAVADGGTCFWLIFRDIADLTDFRRLTVENATWQVWRNGSFRLTLVVDGVDEGLLRVPNFLNDLVALLRDEPLDRFRLILACRTAEWPIDTGRRLLDLWPSKQQELLYELCPLRRKDVEEAARAHECDPGVFLQAIWDRSVVALASRPITLFFLLDEFRQHGGLPATHRELYERGTANLAREVDPCRLDLLRALRKTTPRVNDDERLRAAQRMAALLLLSGRSAIQLSSGAFTPEHERDLSLETAAGGGLFPVTMHALEEAVESALFTSLGERRFGFVHQTFAECLAAQHLHALPLIQLRRMLCQRDSRGEHVVPQLAELSAWVAGANPAFCEHLLRIEPEVLLRSDITRLQGALKSRLVDAILSGACEGNIFDTPGFDHFLAGLNHPGLAEQLLPFVEDRQANHIARRIAINIAEKCRCTGLIEALLKMVMDSDDTAHLRDRGAGALEDIIPENRLALLEPLARGEVFSDSNDTIKGCALRRLVPQYWKVRDILPYLTRPKNARFMGAYEMFLRYSLPEALEDADLPAVLDWLRPKKDCLSSLTSFHRLASVAFSKALVCLDDPSIAGAVADIWQEWLTRRDIHHLPQDSEIQTLLGENENFRRQLWKLHLNHPQTEPNIVLREIYPRVLMQSVDSLDWLLDQISTSPPERRVNWAAAIARFVNVSNATSCWDKLLLQIEEVPELSAQFVWLRAWSLNEQIARDAKARWLRDKRRETEQARYIKQVATPDPKTALEIAFDRFSTGNQLAWVQIWHGLILGKEGNQDHLFSIDLTTCPNWECLSTDQRQAVPTIARSFLLSDARNAAHNEKLDAIHLAAGSAIWMLRESLESDAELRTAIVDHWLGVMVWHVDSSSEPRRGLFCLAYTLAPNAVRDELVREVMRDITRHRLPFSFRVAKDCWDATLSTLAINLIESSFDPVFVQNGLNELAACDLPATLEYVTRILTSVTPGCPHYPVHLFGALVAGLTFGAGDIWALAEPLFNADDALARSVIGKVCYGFDFNQRGLFKDVSEPAMGDFFLTLHRLYPPASDPPDRSDGNVSEADCAIRARGQIPKMLAARGTEAACLELLRLATALPDEATWLRWSHMEAVTNLRRTLWRPTLPQDVRSILESSRARLLTCDDDLLELVIESLDRLQRRLTAQALPAAEDLWRWDGGGLNRTNFRPKDEEALSDYIARWLTEDIGPSAGVVVNREVQPRRGSRTDVIVDATIMGADDDFEKLTVVVEVKGCWHAAARTGLKTQLVDGYLQVHGWRCGIYVVGWFVCPQWENPKNHLGTATPTEGAAELARLASEFDGITSGFRVETYLLDCTLPPITSPSAL